MTRSFLLNDSVCKTFTSKCKRLFHPGPIFGMGIVIFLTFVGLWVHFSTLIYLWKSFACVNLFFCCSLSVFILRSYALSAWYGPGFVMLGWKPKDPKDQAYLQYCRVCDGYKAPRSHHCKTCGRCVLKMDHHCPWINTCVGYLNHSHFLNFVISAPIGCLYCCTLCAYRIYYVITRSFALFRFGYDYKVLFSFYELIILVIGLGLAFGVVLAVGGLGYCQIRGILRNKTAIEDWIMTKAQDRRDSDPTLKPMVYPYDLGWKNNLQQIEQLQQKNLKSKTAVLFRIGRPYSGIILPVTFGCRTFCCPPCSGESRIAVAIGDVVSVTRAHKRWYYGQILSPSHSDDVNSPKGSILPVTFGCRTYCCPPFGGKNHAAAAIGDLGTAHRR
ncbi:unnamed protein product [Hymenolepis diminuta]|uniref:Palmitoyltransferase n=1 Tax=Hymenolepis diminuta TaxID=6216 RepID=A0A0R3S8E0_HYMDI|nr:unnamed protein product [Hymenolepis diminuta]